MYKPNKKDQVRDNRTFWGGLLFVAISAVLAWRVNLTIFITVGTVLYFMAGLRLCLRMLTIRSHLGPLSGRDTGWVYFWIVAWPMFAPLVVYDDFPVMTGEEASLVQSKKGVTNWLEQAAAATRWRLGDPSGHPRSNGENYQV